MGRRPARRRLPARAAAVAGRVETVRLIDVIWLEPDGARVAAAFEVEHTTSIYSGILCMQDLALGLDGGASIKLFLVAPDEREQDVRAQLARPAFRQIGALHVRFIPYSELTKHREAMAKFGQGLTAPPLAPTRWNPAGRWAPLRS